MRGSTVLEFQMIRFLDAVKNVVTSMTLLLTANFQHFLAVIDFF